MDKNSKVLFDVYEKAAKRAAKEIQEYEDNEIIQVLRRIKTCSICGGIIKNGEIVYKHTQEDCDQSVTESVVDS